MIVRRVYRSGVLDKPYPLQLHLTVIVAVRQICSTMSRCDGGNVKILVGLGRFRVPEVLRFIKSGGTMV
jgi:hypothetical protein